jgi:uncharacterized protein (TIGR00106 family)
MHAIAEFTLVPLGAGLSLSPYVAEVERILAEAGVHHELHANGTNLEGEWDVVMAAVRTCHERLHAMGIPRIHTDLRIGTRTDREQRMCEKVESVKSKLP